ncbi:MAG: TIGR04076 family protein [Actinobacteria bacterium]|nr:TIGR04076 family protein [Actinomycetota bacterium]
MKRLTIEIVEVTGRCLAGLKAGNVWEVTENVCVVGENLCYFALSSLMPVLLTIQMGTDPKSLGLSNESGVGYMQCSDIGDLLTPGGKVTFKISEKFPSRREVSTEPEKEVSTYQEVKPEVSYIPRSPACQACGACSMQAGQSTSADEGKLRELITSISKKMLEETGK